MIENFNKKLTELRGFTESIQKEISDFNELVAEKDTSTLRNTRCRLIFSCIESYISHLKQSALLFSMDRPDLFTEAETMYLRDEESFINDKGVVATRRAKIKMKSNLRLAFSSIARALGSNYVLKSGGSGWNSFDEAIKVRDRLTHPKSSKDLEVSDEENEKVEQAWLWFTQSLCEVMKSRPN